MVYAYTIEEINKLKPIDSRLTAIEFVKTDRGKLTRCQCSCGKECLVKGHRIVSGHSRSCSCYNKDITRKRSTKYYPVVKPIYFSFKSMMSRCYDNRVKGFRYYGGKGVRVCDEWYNNYQNFLDWSLANGWAEGLEIDKDIRGDGMLYSPDTCMWVTPLENTQNTTAHKRHLFNGKKMSVAKVAKLTGIPANVLSMRMSSRGRTMEQVVAMGPKTGKSGNTKFFDYKGITISLMAIAKLEGIRYGNLRRDVNDLNIPLNEAILKRKSSIK